MTSKSYPKIISHLIIMVTFKFYKGKYPKKYKVEVYRSGKKIKTTQFGDQRYGQYQDKTPLKLYKKKDTLDKERRRLYRLRHNYSKPLYIVQSWVV